MNCVLRIVYLVILLIVFQSPSGQNTPRYISLFKQAENLYYAEAISDKKDSIALATYLKVIDLHPAGPDSILWVSHFKAGIYLQKAGKFSDAIPYFKKAVSFYGQVPLITGDLLYLPNLYLGNAYYAASMLDSAVYYYKLAEDVANRHPGVEDIERLYNTLGAINYESSNYQQSKIYFEKAIQIATGKFQPGNPLVVSFKNNLASALRQLKMYDKAMSIFNELLKYNVNRDEILHNIGAIYLEQGNDSLAVVYFRKVEYNNQNKFNDLGIAYSRLNLIDSSLSYFRKASDLNVQVNGNRKNTQFAITCKNMGDYYASVEDYDSALIKYQHAIIQLVFDFDEEDIRLNPSSFTGQYSVNELFAALAAKAKIFTTRYQRQKNKNDLLSSIYAYEALYKLADYVTRTYNSEEARLLLTNRKYLLHNEPIDIALILFEQTGDSVYLRHAFRFDEKNKATVLALQMQETVSRQNADLPNELTEIEKKLKQEIIKLQLQLAENYDSTLQGTLRDKQFELSDLHKRFGEYPGYNRLKLIDNTIDIKTLQQIIPEDYAVLSYHLGDTGMLGFVITKKYFRHVYQHIDSSFRTKIRKLYDLIQLTDQNAKMLIDQLRDSLYLKIIDPFSGDISAFKHLMIIPDDELLYLPFEILKPLNKKSLISLYSITYNYSCSLLRTGKGNSSKSSILAMAPFVKTLPASEMEIRNIKGDKITGEKATKEKFIKDAENYTIIHLATHATANDSISAKSYIQFYPRDSSFILSRLFTNEIPGLSLNNVDLVILSACETEAGQLVKGEGLMSLTRAFSYAGCQNTIATLWRADEMATARISRNLHQYIADGKTFAESLRQTKIDYLNDDIPERLKSPAYWAHIRLIGTFEKNKSNSRTYLLIIAAVLVLIAGLIYFSRQQS